MSRHFFAVTRAGLLAPDRRAHHRAHDGYQITAAASIYAVGNRQLRNLGSNILIHTSALQRTLMRRFWVRLQAPATILEILGKHTLAATGAIKAPTSTTRPN